MSYPVRSHAPRGALVHSRGLARVFAHTMRLGALLAAVSAVVTTADAAPKWDPIDPADLASTESASSPGADVEILFERHTLEQENDTRRFGSTLDRDRSEVLTEAYVRVKIYTAKGVQDKGKLSIPSYGTSRVRDVVGRVVKPDGTIHELQKEDIHESTVWKSKVTRQKVTRLAFPNLEPGDIVEYKWRHTGQGDARGRWHYMQQEMPVREFQFQVGSVSEQTFVAWMNCRDVQQSRRGGLTIAARNLPAFEEEEYMPPDREFRSWLYMIQTWNERDHEALWKEVTRFYAEDFSATTAPSGAVKDKARELTADAASDEEKLRRLYEFCQREITNFSFFDTKELQAAREKSQTADDQSPKATLGRKYGWTHEINVLFASLARAAGFDVRLAMNAGIDELLNIRTTHGWAFMNRRHVAVKVGEAWRFFSPGNYLAPFSMLGGQDEGATAVLCGKNDRELIFHKIPNSPAAASRAERRGTFTLSADGTLEGDVEIAWTGHLAGTRRREFWGESQEEIDKDFRDDIHARLPDAEITDLAWENLITQVQPMKVRYHVVVPGYAERVGKRLLVRPGYFETGGRGIFNAETRKYPIAFPFAWQESDATTIQLPEGFELDQPTAPSPAGRTDGEFGSTYQIRFQKKSRTLVYAREFSVGATGALMFQAQSYPTIKSIFENIHRSDTHALMIKPSAPPAAVPADGSTTSAP